jgi:GNAT superfamily N-acetyltransferase
MNDSQVFIRIAAPSDAEKLRAMFARSSQKTIYRRFHTPFPEVPNWMVSLMLEADHHDKESLVAVAEEKVVGHAMYAREGDGGEAEMAILVEDEWQSMGIGKSLLSELEERARHRGIETFVAEVLGENRPMLGLAARSFAGTGYAIEDGVYHVRMPLREAAALDLRAA